MSALSKVIMLRVTPEDYEAWAREAKRAHRSVPNWIRAHLPRVTQPEVEEPTQVSDVDMSLIL